MATKYTERMKVGSTWYPCKDVNAAPINSPEFTGTPKAPTPASTDNSTKIATTAFVKTLVQYLAPLASPALTGTPTAPTPSSSDNSTKIATTAFVKTLTALLAPLASPALTGTPTAPTPSSSDNSTKIATTAFVQTLINALSNEIHASIIEMWSGTSVTPESGMVYRHESGSISSCTINLPNSPANGFICEVDFSSANPFSGVTVKKGSSAYTVKLAGDALNLKGKRYNLIIWWDGLYYCCSSKAF